MSSELWKLIQLQVAEADHAYDTRFLHDLDDRTSWLLRYRGNSVTLAKAASSDDPSSWQNERPFASLTPASIIHLPYYVNAGLQTLRFGIYYRVSDHFYDAGAGVSHARDHVTLTGRLLGFGSGSVELRPVWPGGGSPDGTPPDWGYAEWEATFSPVELGAWTHLTFELRSGRWYSADGTSDGLITGTPSGDSINLSTYQITVNDDPDFYAEASAPPYDASHGANETTCSVLVSGDFEVFQGAWDHFKRTEVVDDDNAAWIWPAGAPPPSLAEMVVESNIYKAPLAYLQWRALAITEVYSDDTLVEPLEKRPAVPTHGRVPATTADRINQANSRMQLVSGLPLGELPGTGSSWDTNGYRRRMPFVLGDDDPQELYRQIGDVVAPAVSEFVFKPVLSSFYYTTVSNEADDTYEEAAALSPRAWIELTAKVQQISGGGWADVAGASTTIQHQMPFVFTQNACHHLIAAELQFGPLSHTPNGDGFVYREGYLDTRTDYPVLQVPRNNPTIAVDVSNVDPAYPVRCVLTAEILDPDPDGAWPGTFADDARQHQADPMLDYRMRTQLVTMSVWGSS